MLEIANCLSVAFTDCNSAFEYFLSFKDLVDKKVKRIGQKEFVEGFRSLSNLRF